ncbi:hypothetical protein AB3S75_031733 [Citrus x aurantiifolia]
MQIKQVFVHDSCKSCLVLIEFLGVLDDQTSRVGYVNVNAVLGNRRNQAITSQMMLCGVLERLLCGLKIL